MNQTRDSGREKRSVHMSLKDRFREWLSDNLRYILLGIGIVIVVVLIFLGVKFLTSSMKQDNNTQNKSTSQDVTATPDAGKQDKDDDSSSATDSKDKEPAGTLTKDGNAEITALMNTYYTALGGKNMDVLATVVDELSEEEKAQINAESNIEGYQDIAAYTFNGQQEGTYVVIASFNCKYKEIDTMAPGLTQMYIYTNTEGKLVIDAEVEDEAVNTYMQDIQNQPDVKKLIEDTQAAYEAARASDAKLDALISSVAGN